MINKKDWKEVLSDLKLNTEEIKEKFIDTHAHYNVRQYNEDRDKLLEKLQQNLKIIINCGTNTKSNKETIDLCKQYNYFYGTIGYFPCDTLELEKDPSKINVLKNQCKNNKIVGIGEIGLDYHWNSVGYGKDTIKGSKAIEIQKKWFIEQIKLANELKLPICVHSRDAEKDTLEILKKHNPKYGCAIHCYAYGLDSAKEYAKMGYYFGVGGTSTYKNNTELKEVLKYIPLEQILLETDAPYLTPEPNRRKRNDSEQIKFIIDNLSEIKGISTDKIICITNENVQKLYNIK